MGPGTTAYLDGPHGNLTLKGRSGKGIALIAGGVGVAPLLSIARQLDNESDPRPLILLYGNRLADQIVYEDELKLLAGKNNRDVRLVLSEPESTAIFMGFGDSTLDLELRVFIVGRDNAFNVRDELNLAINEAFRASGLEIAYPQRDLHIKSVDGVSLGLFDNHSKKAA